VKEDDPDLQGGKVRLVTEESDQQIVPVDEALQMASDAGQDLVLVAEQADPPVCRLMDYTKHVYEQKRRKKEQRKKQLANRKQNKEIQFHANIDAHDYKIKLNHILDFLKDGHKVKVSLRFRGREMAHKEIGRDLMRQVVDDVSGFGQVENPPKEMGRTIQMLLAPVSSK